MHTNAPIVPQRPAARAVPTVVDALWFAFRASCFRLRRHARNAFDRDHRRHAPGSSALEDAPVIVEVRSPLRPGDDPPERTLLSGKIQNLRVARLAFDGLVLRASDVLSVWAQLGAPTRRRGFVIGRELREGCLIPSIGGGLCQLSNALYQAGVRAGLEVLERHAHSRVVPGSAAELGHDATVFWNYVDLRLRAPFDLRLEVALDHETLRVRIRAYGPAPVERPRGHHIPLRQIAGGIQAPGDCANCGEVACHRNAGSRQPAAEKTRAALVGTQSSAEHAAVLEAVHGLRRVRASSSIRLRCARTWLRLKHRLTSAPPARRAMDAAALEAAACMAALQPDDEVLYVEQALLPHLWRGGALAGRRFHVLMHTLPMHEIHAALEYAAARHPDEPSLRDFRADKALVAAERAALDAATAAIGPHAVAIGHCGARGHLLPWLMPPPLRRQEPRPAGPLRVLFPASSLIRKGVLTLAEAARGLSVDILLPHRDGGDAARWDGLRIQRCANLDEALVACDAVVLPAWVEHQPYILLRAIATGIPVIATAACGLGCTPGWTQIGPGDSAALRAALSRLAGACSDAPGHAPAARVPTE